MTMRRRPDSIITRLCPYYRFQKGRQKILNYDTVDIRHKHHAIAALPSLLAVIARIGELWKVMRNISQERIIFLRVILNLISMLLIKKYNVLL